MISSCSPTLVDSWTIKYMLVINDLWPVENLSITKEPQPTKAPEHFVLVEELQQTKELMFAELAEPVEYLKTGEVLAATESKSTGKIHTAHELLTAMQEQAGELNDEYVFSIGGELDVTSLINGTTFDYLDSVRWIYNYITDTDGNEIPQEYNDYEFYIRYRDDFKALTAHRRPELRSKLTQREEELLKKSESVIDEIIEPGMSEYQKVLAIHDYLVLNAEYDTRVDTDELPESNQRAEGVLLNGMGVCSSFASAMKLLLGMVGIECLYVTGEGIKKDGSIESHAWNKVRIDGKWYNIDTTWDNPVAKRPGEIKYAYMCVTDDMLARNHIWDHDAYPRADSLEYNYYYYNKLIATDYAEFMKIISDTILAKREEPIIIARAYITDFDEDVYNLQFIYEILPDINRVSYSYFAISGADNSNDEGEMIIWAYRTEN